MVLVGHSGRLSGAVLRSRHAAHVVGQIMTTTTIRTAPVRLVAAIKDRATRPHYVSAGYWLAQFALLTFFMFFEGPSTRRAHVSLDSSPRDMLPVFGGSDSGSYLGAAFDLVANGTNTDAWAWVLNLWPPGMVWIDALILRLSPLPFGVSIGLLNAFAWSVPLAILTRAFVKTRKALVITLLVESAVLATSPFYSWMLDEGLFYADGLSVALFLLGLSLVVNRARSSGPVEVWIRDGIYVGVAFAAAIYLRAAFQLLPWATGALAVILLIIVVARRARRRPLQDLLGQLGLVATATIVIVVLMQPYTAYLQEERDRSRFVTLDDLVYEGVWRNNTVETSPQWAIDGGMSVGCDIDPEKCADIQEDQAAGVEYTPEELRNSLVESIVTHPVQFVGNRGGYLLHQWFADESAAYSNSHTSNPPQGLLYLAALMTAVISACILASRGRLVLLLVPFVTLSTLAPFAAVHIEVRYLIPLKIIGLLTPLLLLSMREHPGRTVEGRRLGLWRNRRSGRS